MPIGGQVRLVTHLGKARLLWMKLAAAGSNGSMQCANLDLHRIGYVNPN